MLLLLLLLLYLYGGISSAPLRSPDPIFEFEPTDF